MRQDKFLDHVDQLGWLTSNTADTTFILGCIHAYHGFLEICSKSGSKMVVPTIAIDVAWHTHQLQGDRYRLDTKKYLGRLLNHQDKVEEGVLGLSSAIFECGR